MILAEQANRITDMIQAMAEGKEVQYLEDGEWKDVNILSVAGIALHAYTYRIKGESEYRPFQSVGECFAEMQKHHPFGWVRGKRNDGYVQIQYVMESDDSNEAIIVHFAPDEEFNEKMSLECYTFADGEPFGIKDE